MTFWEKLAYNFSSTMAEDPGLITGILLLVAVYACSAYLAHPLYRRFFGYGDLSSTLYIIIILPLSLVLMLLSAPAYFVPEIFGIQNEGAQMLLATLFVTIISFPLRHLLNRNLPVRSVRNTRRMPAGSSNRKLFRSLTGIELFMIVVAMTSIFLAIDQITNYLDTGVRHLIIVAIALPLVILILVDEIYGLREIGSIFSRKRSDR